AAQAAAALTSQMLVYIGRTPGVMQPANLSKLMDDLRPRFQASRSERTTLQLDLPADLPAVPADPALLHRAIMALFFNACEAIGGGPGILAMRTRAVHVSPAVCAELFMEESLPEGQYVWVQISDTGVGLD